MPDPARLTDEQIREYESFAEEGRQLSCEQTLEVLAALNVAREELFDDPESWVSLKRRLAAAEEDRDRWMRAGAHATDALKERLTAAENVVEAARGVAYSKPSDLSRLASALAAYDAHKREPTGNHAESSQARGDTNE